MEEIYLYFLKKEKENGDILIKDFFFIFVMLKLNFLVGGGMVVIVCFINFIFI